MCVCVGGGGEGKLVRDQRGKRVQLTQKLLNRDKKSCSRFSHGQEASAGYEGEG